MSDTKGKFIVIEGGEGVGKNTQSDLLLNALKGQNVLFVKDPGTTEIGLRLREVLLHHENVGRETELLLYLAARAQLVSESIKPALAEGTHVISNRFDLSTIAYQVYGRERHDVLETLEMMSAYALGGVRPDLVILLDLTPEEGLRRVGERAQALNNFEKIDMDFHKRVRDGYLKHVADYPNHLILDASKTPEAIHEEVLQAVEETIGAG